MTNPVPTIPSQPVVDLAVEHLLRVIAACAVKGTPLPEALDAYGSPLARAVAGRLREGTALPDAIRGELGDDLADLLAGPHPPVEGAALLVAEHLRMRRQDRLDRMTTLLHPILSLIATAIALPIILHIMGQPPAIVWLALAVVLALGVALLPLLLNQKALAQRLPRLAQVGHHAAHAQRYERAALVARWHLSEARLAPFLGDDLGAIAPLLSQPGAEEHCRRLAQYHRQALIRARHHLHRLIQALILAAGGALILAAGAGIIPALIQDMAQVIDIGG